MTPLQELTYKKLQKQYSNSEWKYIAVDKYGDVFVYKIKPKKTPSLKIWAGNAETTVCQFIYNFNSTITNWESSLKYEPFGFRNKHYDIEDATKLKDYILNELQGLEEAPFFFSLGYAKWKR
jgi:hypothetical protein